MNPIERVKSLSNGMFALFVFSKGTIGFGLGFLVAGDPFGIGWWVLGAGIVLSIPGWKVALLG